MYGHKIKIIGGGIAGLASALAVSNTGGTAMVFEKAKTLNTLGAGLQLGPNAVRALQKLGAWDAVKPLTYAPPEIHIRDGQNGKILKRLPLGDVFEKKYGELYLTAHRADLHEALLKVASTKSHIELKTNVEVDNLNVEEFDGIIAADGVWSKSRETLFPNTKAIITSDTYFRSLVPLPSNVGDVELTCVNLWLYPNGHVVHYPVGCPPKLNLIAITNGQVPLSFFKNASVNLQDVLALPSEYSKWPSAYVPPLKQWHQTKITLIGDAAHGTMPYLAQGAAMALEDGAMLQDKLNSEINFQIVVQSLFEHRHNRVGRLHKSSLSAGQIYHLEGLPNKARNLALALMPNSALGSQLSWIYKYRF